MPDAPFDLRYAWLGDRAVQFDLPRELRRKEALAALRELSESVDVVLAERVGCLHLREPYAAPSVADLRAAIARAMPTRGEQAQSTAPSVNTPRRRHTIDVSYDGEDLAFVARECGLSEARVIELHASVSYRVCMVGFSPGFAYLGEVPQQIVLDRRSSPRARVEALSVALAGTRTAIYPCASPGGWHLLGRARSFVPFDVQHGATLQLDDEVTFRAI